MNLKTPKLPSRSHHGAAPSQPQAPAATPATAVRPPAPAVRPPAPSEPVAPLKKVAGGLGAATRQRNAAVMIAGVALIVLAGAMAASVASSFDDSIEVLVAAGPIAEGAVIEEDDFRVVSVAAGAGDIQAVSPNSQEALIGRVAAGPIGEGSMIHPDQFTANVDEVRVVVGAALVPDQYPAKGLKPGDRVRLIEVVDQYSSSGDGGLLAGREITVGEITDVVPLSSSDTLHFSIRIGESTSGIVADRIAQDRLTLALLDESEAIDRPDPLSPAQPVDPLEIAEQDEESDQ